MMGPSMGELASMRRTVAATFRHTYTRIPRQPTADNPATPSVDESQDAWGEQATSTGTAEPGRPCKYRERSSPVITPNGLLNVNIPILWIPTTDTLTEGDLVRDITDAYGKVLLSGPVEVEDTSDRGLSAGGALHIEVTLRQTQQV